MCVLQTSFPPFCFVTRSWEKVCHLSELKIIASLAGSNERCQTLARWITFQISARMQVPSMNEYFLFTSV